MFRVERIPGRIDRPTSRLRDAAAAGESEEVCAAAHMPFFFFGGTAGETLGGLIPVPPSGAHFEKSEEKT